MIYKERKLNHFLVIRKDGQGFRFILDGSNKTVRGPLTAYKVRRVVGGFSHRILKGKLVYRVRMSDLEKALEELSSKDEVKLRIEKIVIEDSGRCIVVLLLADVLDYVRNWVQSSEDDYVMKAYDRTIFNTLKFLIRHEGAPTLKTTLRYLRHSLAGMVKPSAKEFEGLLKWAEKDVEALRVFVRDSLVGKFIIWGSRLMIINNTVGFYVKPEVVTGESIYVVKGFTLKPLPEYVLRLVKVFQIAYPRHRVVLIGLPHDGTLERIELNPVKSEEAVGYLRELERFGLEKGKPSKVNLCRCYAIAYTIRNNSLVFDEYPPLYTR